MGGSRQSWKSADSYGRQQVVVGGSVVEMGIVILPQTPDFFPLGMVR